MWAKDPLNDIKESIKLTLNENITQIKDGDNLLKSIIGQSLIFNKQIKDSKEKEIEFAKKYQILSKNTALFGEIVREGESQKTELIKVDINEERKNAINRNVVSAMRPQRRMLAKGISSNRSSGMTGKMFKGLSNIPTKTLAKNSMNYVKKPSYEQKSNGTVGIIDEFNDMLMTQDIIEGYWDETPETKRMISKIKKGVFEKIVEYIKSRNITDNLNRVVYTIFVIY